MSGGSDRVVLIVRLSALGDVAMTVPAIYSVARCYSETSFKVLTRRLPARLFVNSPSNVTVITANDDEIGSMTGLYRLLRRLAEEGVTDVADLHNVLRSWIIDGYFMARGRRVAMVDKQRLERYRRHESKRPFVERYFDVFKRLGLGAADTFDGVLPHVADGGGCRRVGIAPFARYKSKTYPLAMMRRVVDELSVRSDVKIFLFGGRGTEADELAVWASGKDNVTSVAGAGVLESELSLMATLDLMVSMDSANMHLASLVGTRVLSVWGGTTPDCGFLGHGQRREDTIEVGLGCQPCTTAGGDGCRYGDFRCLAAISPEYIVSRIEEILVISD
ncbi:MAG: glycosyltransferase family 9 protein [Muribaculaceae bacterium]|nr:glycosyltransferase family 9 protein [Muribaculaceae bacterium]